MSSQEVQIIGEEGVKYQLPEGMSFQTFNWDKTYAILQEGLGGAFKNGSAVVDSFDIRRPPEGQTPTEAVRDLLLRNGARPISVPK